ncbi:MAG: DUF6282 family protein [Acidobacteriota bacterium]
MTGELAGAFDLHVHCSPDTRPRKLTAHELAAAAQTAGMGGLVLKNHQIPTAPVAEVLRSSFPGLHLFGGLVLNTAIGGFNVEAVDIAIRMGAKQIWMPTRSAAHECRFLGSPEDGLRIHDNSGNLFPAVQEILDLIAKAGIILGTAHVSPDEIALLVREGRRMGLQKILINHPEIEFVNLSHAMQNELSGPGVYFERCYARKGFLLDWDGLAAVTRAVGFQSTVLATDLGQPENPDPVSGLSEMRRQFAARGFSDDELRTMLCDTPASLLGLA